MYPEVGCVQVCFSNKDWFFWPSASHCSAVPPDVSTSVKDIWIGNVLLLEKYLLKFLPAPETFWRKDDLGWVWVFFIYLFEGSFNDPEQEGGIFVSKSRCN